MNDIDRKRLTRLSMILEAVPFSSRGTATSTGYGAVMYEQDMRALRPYVRKIINGMVLEGNPYFEEGFDYDDPDKMLDKVEKWTEKRKLDGWQNAAEYSLEYFEKDGEK